MKTDFLVIGSGIAGLYFALNASKYGKCLVITKGEISESNTKYAQGGIAAVFDKRHYKYHGLIKELAEGAREGGLKF